MVKKSLCVFNPPVFQREEDNQIARILLRFYTALLAAYTLIIITRLFVRDIKEVILLLLGFMVVSFSFFLLKKLRLRTAVITLGLGLFGQITVIALMGQGVRDLAILGYPAILITISLMLNQRDYLLMSLFTLMCILIITIGPLAGLYTPVPPPAPGAGDFIIVAAITALAVIMSCLISENMQQNMAKAHREIQERKKIEEILTTSLHEKDSLLKEVHHRVKNNLTVINSLLSLQKRQIETRDDAVSAFDDMRSRIFSMAQVHEQLYKSDSFSRIAMYTYIRSMTANLKSMYDSSLRIDFDLAVDDISLSIDSAVPCGIIINELVTNSLKHAFPETRQGKVSISLQRAGKDRCLLTFSDNGVGIPREIDFTNPSSLGLKLVKILTEQLNGHLRAETVNGARFYIDFPLKIAF